MADGQHPRICPRCGYRSAQVDERRCPADGRHLVEEAEYARAVHDPMLGALLGDRYPLLGLLGRGGMGAVYRSVQPILEREVAVKVILPSAGARGPIQAQRFLQEARSVARLQHPAIVTLHDFGVESDGTLFMVMELVQGPTLQEALSTRGLTLRSLLSITLELLDALGHAHGIGIIHRDLKPENILLLPDPGEGSLRPRVKLLDFGLAQLLGEAGALRLTAEGSVAGSPFYVSPEQVEGKSVDARSDLYSLCAVLYEALAGRPPFVADSRDALMMLRLQRQPAPLNADPGWPQGLAEVVLKGLERWPQDRWASAAALSGALRSLVQRVPEGLVLPAPVAQASAGSPAELEADLPPVEALDARTVSGLSGRLGAELRESRLLELVDVPPPPLSRRSEPAEPEESAQRAPSELRLRSWGREDEAPILLDDLEVPELFSSALDPAAPAGAAPAAGRAPARLRISAPVSPAARAASSAGSAAEPAADPAGGAPGAPGLAPSPTWLPGGRSVSTAARGAAPAQVSAEDDGDSRLPLLIGAGAAGVALVALLLVAVALFFGGEAPALDAGLAEEQRMADGAIWIPVTRPGAAPSAGAAAEGRRLVSAAQEALDGERFAEGERLARRALSYIPGEAEAYYVLGRCLLSQGQASEAESQLSLARRSEPGNVVYLAWLSYALDAQPGREAEARRLQFEAEAALQANPGDNEELADFDLRLGRALLADGSAKAAALRLSRAIQQDDAQWEPWFLLGEALYRMELFGQAVEVYRRALALRPDLLEAYARSGTALLMLPTPDTEGAAQQFRRLIERDKDNRFPVAHKQLAFIYRDAGRRAESLAELRRYLELTSKESPDRREIEDEVRSLEVRRRR